MCTNTCYILTAMPYNRSLQSKDLCVCVDADDIPKLKEKWNDKANTYEIVVRKVRFCNLSKNTLQKEHDSAIANPVMSGDTFSISELYLYDAGFMDFASRLAVENHQRAESGRPKIMFDGVVLTGRPKE